VPKLDVLLGEAMWADMLVASIEIGRREIRRATAPRPVECWSSIVVPFDRNSSQRGMPVLAAFDAIRPNGFANAYEPGRTSHAHA